FMMILAPISVGDLFDKISILRVKAARITGRERIENVQNELRELEKLIPANLPPSIHETVEKLREINATLWDIEDSKRECERLKRFDEHFIGLARQVYIRNDERARLKRSINDAVGSSILEE